MCSYSDQKALHTQHQLYGFYWSNQFIVWNYSKRYNATINQKPHYFLNTLQTLCCNFHSLISINENLKLYNNHLVSVSTLMPISLAASQPFPKSHLCYTINEWSFKLCYQAPLFKFTKFNILNCPIINQFTVTTTNTISHPVLPLWS